MIREQPGHYTEITLGRVRPDREALVAESELSFWSRPNPVFVTKEGKLIPATTNRPTARISLFRNGSAHAIAGDAYPRARLRKQWRRLDGFTRALQPSGALGRFIKTYVTADARIVSGVLRWIGWDGASDPRDMTRGLSSLWRWKHEASDVWDTRDIPEGIAGALLLERWDANDLVARVTTNGAIVADDEELERKRSPRILTAVAIPRSPMRNQ